MLIVANLQDFYTHRVVVKKNGILRFKQQLHRVQIHTVGARRVNYTVYNFFFLFFFFLFNFES